MENPLGYHGDPYWDSCVRISIKPFCHPDLSYYITRGMECDIWFKLAWAFKGGGIGMDVLGLLTIILGILLLLNPLAGAVILPWVYVFSLIVGGWNCSINRWTQYEV
ncbi:hypothetical protein RG963_03120 [Methanosarcina sp. Z-7115]|uniref:Uncharacterized protein n=1 Tax=Methanosarcina baikalica TaxID=3073890 RepID=A0ABU2CYH0_9EURY|nr:hypothetical protein [Methanosarcina sp. Z-7115]MDR7664790.1 hypothetical protein [Methanosarcina sp. Z-7115]